MPASALGSSSASAARTFSSTFPPSRRTGTSRGTKAKRLNSRSPRAPRACRRRTFSLCKLYGGVPIPSGRPFFSLCPVHAAQGGILKGIAEGQYIKHFQYGLGVIKKPDADRTSIDFDVHGMKKFVTSLMVVEPAEGTPPKRKRASRRKKAVAPTLAKPAAVAVAASGTK